MDVIVRSCVDTPRVLLGCPLRVVEDGRWPSSLGVSVSSRAKGEKAAFRDAGLIPGRLDSLCVWL